MSEIKKWHEPDLHSINNGRESIYPSLHMWGHTFSPRRLTEETGFRGFSEANERVEVNVAGPYRGQPVSAQGGYGSAIIRPPENIDPDQRLWWMMEQILPGHTRKFCKEFGIVESCMYLTVHYQYQQECCLVLPYVFLQSLCDTPLVITSVQATKPPDSFAV